MSLARLLALVQGAYYVATGLWSLVHLESFLWVTGPKTDVWLVRTVGALVVVAGSALLLAARRPQPVREVVLLAIGCALALALVEVFYVANGTIRSIYLGDALVEALLALAWVQDWWRSKKKGGGEGAARGAAAELDA